MSTFLYDFFGFLSNILEYEVQYNCTYKIKGVINLIKDRLKSMRIKRGLTQDDLAKKVNTKKTTISNYETGYSTPSNEMLVDIAKVLNVSADYLLGLSDIPNLNKNNDELSIDEEVRRLIEDPDFMVAYKKMPGTPEETREYLKEFMKMTIKQDRKRKK